MAAKVLNFYLNANLSLVSLINSNKSENNFCYKMRLVGLNVIKIKE